MLCLYSNYLIVMYLLVSLIANKYYFCIVFRNEDFHNAVNKFVAQKSDILFRSLEQPPTFPCNKRTDGLLSV